MATSVRGGIGADPTTLECVSCGTPAASGLLQLVPLPEDYEAHKAHQQAKEDELDFSDNTRGTFNNLAIDPCNTKTEKPENTDSDKHRRKDGEGAAQMLYP